HTLTICTTVSACLLLVLVDHDPLLPRLSAENISLIASFAAFLSLRTIADVEVSHWWSVGPLLVLTALATRLNWRTLLRRYIFAAGILFNLAVSVWWVFVLDQEPFASPLLLTNLIAAS